MSWVALTRNELRVYVPNVKDQWSIYSIALSWWCRDFNTTLLLSFSRPYVLQLSFKKKEKQMLSSVSETIHNVRHTPSLSLSLWVRVCTHDVFLLSTSSHSCCSLSVVSSSSSSLNGPLCDCLRVCVCLCVCLCLYMQRDFLFIFPHPRRCRCRFFFGWRQRGGEGEGGEWASQWLPA